MSIDRSSGKKRTALYLRVSRNSQETDNQRPDLVHLACSRGLDIVAIYEETVSAVKQRPSFDKMMLAAHRGEWDCLLVWSLDRFGRSMADNLNAVLDLDRLRVQVLSVREPWLDTRSPIRHLLIAIFSWVAEQERRRIAERTKAGLERARRRGAKIGRPRVNVDVEKAKELKAGGMPIKKVSQQLGIGLTTLRRALRRAALYE